MGRRILKCLIFCAFLPAFFGNSALGNSEFYTARERGDWISERLTLSRLEDFKSFQGQLRPGDVILVPLRCMSCFYIEAETRAPFSHSAVVLGRSGGKVVVAEALGELRTLSLKKFLSRARKGIPWVAMRPEFSRSFERITPEQKQRLLKNRFSRNFSHLQFDGEYRWNDRDQNGNEKLYCSEFIVKFLDPYLEFPLKPKPMSFSRFPDFWRRYYNGATPSRELGFSPADLYHARGFTLKSWLFVETSQND